MLFAVKVTSAFDRLTRPERVNILILDDSVIKRNCSKNVELLARVYDHVEHKFQKGFTLLTLGLSDGYSFIPTGFNLLSSASESNRYNEVSDSIDHRTNGYKVRKASMMHKTDAAIQLIRKSSRLRHAFSSRRYCGFYILRVPPEAVRFPVPVAQYVDMSFLFLYLKDLKSFMLVYANHVLTSLRTIINPNETARQNPGSH